MDVVSKQELLLNAAWVCALEKNRIAGVPDDDLKLVQGGGALLSRVDVECEVRVLVLPDGESHRAADDRDHCSTEIQVNGARAVATSRRIASETADSNDMCPKTCN